MGGSRLDRLGREVLLYALSRKGGRKTYVEFGPGKGRLALAIALLGYDVHLYERKGELEGHYRKVVDCTDMGLKVRFHIKDITHITYRDLPDGISVFVASRVLHYLRYGDALRVLKVVRAKMERGGRLFMMFSGISSPLSEGYPDVGKPVEMRFSHLSRDVAGRFGIGERVCLYGEEDVRKLLSEVGGLEEILLQRTKFGNVLAVYGKGKV